MTAVIVIADTEDLHADRVVQRLLDSNADVMRIDPYDPKQDLFFDSDRPDKAVLSGTSIKFENISGLYCRYALDSLTQVPDSPVDHFCFAEYISSLSDLCLRVDSRRWINFPWAEANADGKINPLIIASDLGISVPRFIVTDNPQRLKNLKLTDDWIIKPISDHGIGYQNGLYSDQLEHSDFSAPYTKTLDWSLIDFSKFENAPFLIQKKIDKSYDIRATCIDEVVFATRVKSNPEVIDSRLINRDDEDIFVLDQDEKRQLIQLTKRLGLRFCAYDLLQENDGRCWLVDVNPSGNWLWQDTHFDEVLSSTIARALFPN